MAINLLNNSLNNIQNSGQQVSGQVGAAAGSQAMRQAAMTMLNELRSMMPGDTLSGQLVSKDGSSIQLLLNNNTLLNTTLDQDVNIGLGKQVSFEVKSNHNGQLTLRPMFTNLNNSSTIMNALNAAGIAAGDDTIAMVDNLMKNSMPINKDMLQTINHEMNMYPDAEVADIVMLHKMDIPVNDANIRQMELYRGNNQWMLENIDDSANELSDMLLNSITSGDENAETLINGLKEILVPAEDVEVLPEENTDDNMTQVSENTSKEKPQQIDGNTNNINKNDSIPLQKETLAEDAVDKNEAKGEKDSINKFNVFDKLSKLDKEALKNPEIKGQVNKALSDLLKDNFLMNPKDIAEDKFVKKYYERTMDLSDQLAKLMTETGKTDTDFSKTVTNLRENTNFMNQINELYNYVQLPLKMNDSHANGDLYVYARKKGRGTGGEDGKLTALLHLSMENLGNMDIFLTLKEGQNLSTKFTLEKEEMIDFIESHIDELNERLIKKGYNLGTTFVGKKDESDSNVIENIVKADGDNILLSTQSFDARA